MEGNGTQRVLLPFFFQSDLVELPGFVCVLPYKRTEKGGGYGKYKHEKLSVLYRAVTGSSRNSDFLVSARSGEVFRIHFYYRCSYLFHNNFVFKHCQPQ